MLNEEKEKVNEEIEREVVSFHLLLVRGKHNMKAIRLLGCQ